MGPTKVKVREMNTWTARIDDPNLGDMVYAQFDWGDGLGYGKFGPDVNGAVFNGRYIYNIRINYNIRVRGLDEHGATGNWSDTLPVSAPKNKTVYTLFMSFLENHPFMLPLLRQLRVI